MAGQDRGEEGNGTRSGFSLDLAVLGGYAVASAFALYPLLLRLGAAVPGPSTDLWQNLWNFWWVREAVVELGRSPFETSHLLFPYEANLAFHTFSLLNTISAVPLGGFLSAPALLGISLFLTFPIGAWGAYLLARELTGSRWGSLAAGWFYAFLPHHVDQLGAHLNLASTHILPFFLLGVLRLARRTSGRGVLFVGGFYALVGYACWTYLFHALLLHLLVAMIACGRGAIPGRAPGWFGHHLLAGIVGAMLLLPLLRPPLEAAAERGSFVYKPPRRHHSVSFESLALPPVSHSVLGGIGPEARPGSGRYPHGSVTYLGLAPLLLAAAGAGTRKPWIRPLGLLGLLFLLLALGPDLQVRTGKGMGIPLPYAALQELPLFRFLRVPNRFLVPFALLWVPLLAAGMARIAGRRDRARLLAPVLGLLLLFEYLPAPVGMLALGRPPYVDRLRADSEGEALLDVPILFGPSSALYMYYQTFHEKPIAGGYISIPQEAYGRILDEEPALRPLAPLSPGERVRDTSGPIRPLGEALRRLGFGNVVLHKDPMSAGTQISPPGMGWEEGSEGARWYRAFCSAGVKGRLSAPSLHRTLSGALGPPYYEDEDVAIFAVP